MSSSEFDKITGMDMSEEKKLLQPENHNKKYESLFNEIDTGQIKLPMFQREFVWEKEQSAKLIDSIIKGFPIGTFIFWKTREELRSYKDVGNHKLPDTPKGDYVQYILDGQQRITSLYTIRKGIRINKDGKEVDYKDIFIDLAIPTESDESLTTSDTPSENDSGRYISVHRLLTSQISDLLEEFDRDKLRVIESYKGKLVNYDFSTITIKDYPIEIACEIFSRINTGGKSLTIFEIMVAKTYDEVRGFDLADKFETLRDGSEEEKRCLAEAKFDTLPESIVMQCVSAIVSKAVRGRDILKLKREIFIDTWPLMVESLFSTVDFIRSELRVPVSHLLPYPALTIPLTYFFYRTGNKKPSSKQIKMLEQFFYWCGVTERYSSASDTKITDDLNKIDKIISGEEPKYLEDDLHVSKETIKKTYFSTGNAFCKSILCILVYNQPRSFDTDGIVILDNSNLKIASSRNYHHFFPKKYLEANYKEAEPNLVANITLIDGYSNKHRIGKKPPSEYIGKFSEDNSQIENTLKSHLINDMKEFGINSDEYDVFIDKRSCEISSSLTKKLTKI